MSNPKTTLIEHEATEPTPARAEGPGPAESTPEEVRHVLLGRHFSGPLPAPDTLEHYTRIIPNAGERFFQIWEQEIEHRRKLEHTEAQDRQETQRALIQDQRRTQAYALILALSVLVTSVYFISKGHDAAGTSVLLGEIVALAALFVGGRSKKKPSSSHSSDLEKDPGDST